MKPAQDYTTMKSIVANTTVIMHLKHSCIFLYKDSLDNISPPTKSLKLCQSDDSDSYYKDIAVYPGDEATITLKALGQTGLKVPAILVTKETHWRYNKYSINPRYQQIVNVCRLIHHFGSIWVTKAVNGSTLT